MAAPRWVGISPCRITEAHKDSLGKVKWLAVNLGRLWLIIVICYAAQLG